MLADMKPRTVKTKIKQLIKKYGSRKQVAQELNIALSYVYRLEKGMIPGWRLYKDVCHYANEK